MHTAVDVKNTATGVVALPSIPGASGGRPTYTFATFLVAAAAFVALVIPGIICALYCGDGSAPQGTCLTGVILASIAAAMLLLAVVLALVLAIRAMKARAGIYGAQVTQWCPCHACASPASARLHC